MSGPSHLRSTLAFATILAALCPIARAAEHVTLRNGFEFDCARHETTGDRVRLYLLPAATATPTQREADTNNYMEVAATAILRVETTPDPVPLPTPPTQPAANPGPWATNPDLSPTPTEIHQLLATAGQAHDVDTDLLASIVHAESNGNARAVSRAGARGLMQLMPATAAQLGVQNSFAPDQNIGGGTAYLDALLVRYHNDMKLALAAYNAGPDAVDRYHGIPPYPETRAYVARVINEFNRLKRAANPQLAAAK